MARIKKFEMIFAVVAAGLIIFAGHTCGYANLVIKDFVAFPGKPDLPSDGGLEAEFVDLGGGSVLLTMTILQSLYGAKITEWGFNYNGIISNLSFEAQADVAANEIVLGPTAQTRANGDGYYDFIFLWDPKSPIYFGSNENRTVSYIISAISGGVKAEDFDLASWNSLSSGKTRSGYDSAVHVQQWPTLTGPGTWAGGMGELTAVPIPASAWLLASGLIGLVVIRRRIKKKLPFRNGEKVY